MGTCTFRKQAITVKNDRIVQIVMYSFRLLKIALSEIDKFLQCEIQIHSKRIYRLTGFQRKVYHDHDLQ